MTCQDALAGLAGALDGEGLTDAVEQEIAAHLDSCDSCARAAREMSGLHRLLLEQRAEAMTPRRRKVAPRRPAGVSMGIPAVVAAGFLATVIALLALTSSDPPAPPPAKIVRPPTAEFRKAEVKRARVEEARRETEDRVDELRRLEKDRRKETDDAFADIVRRRKLEEERLAKLKAEEEAAAQESQKALLVPEPAPRPTTQVAVLRVARADGKVNIINTLGPREAQDGDELARGESLQTLGARSGALLIYPDGTRVGAGPDTVLRELQDRNGERLEIRQGTIWADVAKQPANRPFRFMTPHGEAKVLGTALRMRVETGTRLEVEEGKVELRNAAGKKVDVSTGQYGVAAAGIELASHPLPALVFGDAFEGLPVNEWPKGWLKHGDGASRSAFAVLGGGILGVVSPPARTTQHANFPVDAWPAKFTLSYRMRLSGGRTDRAGIELDDERMDPAFEYDAVAGVVKVDWPRSKILKQVAYRIAPNTWTEWSISVDGRQFRISIDKMPVLDLELPEFGRVRGASLVSRGADGAHFDDVKVLRR